MKLSNLIVAVLAVGAIMLPLQSHAAIKKVKNVHSTQVQQTSVTVQWRSITKATFYKVQLRKNNGTKVKTWKNVRNTRKKIKSSTGLLNPETRYKVRVRACTNSACGKWSKYKTFTTDYLDADSDGVRASDDCNDNNANVSSNITYYRDADEDGLGASGSTTTVCSTIVPDGYVTNANDSDDNDYFNGSYPVCSSNLYNCSDFSSHSTAQKYYDYCVAQGAGDIHRLDSDNDGGACESLD